MNMQSRTLLHTSLLAAAALVMSACSKPLAPAGAQTASLDIAVEARKRVLEPCRSGPSCWS